MKTKLSLLGFLLLIVAPLRADLVLQSSDFVAIVGDSITEQKKYSVFMEDYFLMCRPVEGLRAAQFGWGGEAADGCAGRMNSDILTFKPTVATTCYGMNDGGYRPLQPTTKENYRKNMTAVVD